MSLNRPRASGHRLGVSCWTLSQLPLPTHPLPRVMETVAAMGRDGFEHWIVDLRRYFPGQRDEAIARHLATAARQAGVRCLGSIHLLEPHQFTDIGGWDELLRQLDISALMGAEFVNTNLKLPAHYLETGGAYRDDDRFLRTYAQEFMAWCEAARARGLNVYAELHINYVTEDPVAAVRFGELAGVGQGFEWTADVSHYLHKGIERGAAVEKLYGQVGHVHGRLCKRYGDLSANVDDPAQDWAQRGLTWQWFTATLPCLRRGLSSRLVTGESGPIFGVKDAIGLDRKLTPLWRAAARVADLALEGVTVKIDSPEDLRPWG